MRPSFLRTTAAKIRGQSSAASRPPHDVRLSPLWAGSVSAIYGCLLRCARAGATPSRFRWRVFVAGRLLAAEPCRVLLILLLGMLGSFLA